MATYRLVRKLAAGGMAEVFLAKVVGAEGFEKPVAVKRVLPSLAQDKEFIELFLREAKLTVSLQHANVVQVFDLGGSHGQYYMVMEFVDGENLRTLQRAAAGLQVGLGMREVCFIVQQVAEGLAYAHEKLDAAGRPLNIIHRDINPSNVMIAAAGEVKLADFGIAKAANVQSGTQAGVVKGKVGYLAPEQVRGGTVDQRADLFLLGLLLYELLSGQQLFSGPDYFQILRNISSFEVKTVVPVPGVPAPLVEHRHPGPGAGSGGSLPARARLCRTRCRTSSLIIACAWARRTWPGSSRAASPDVAHRWTQAPRDRWRRAARRSGSARRGALLPAAHAPFPSEPPSGRSRSAPRRQSHPRPPPAPSLQVQR